MSANLQQNIEYCDVHIDDLDNIYLLELKSYPYPWTKGILRDCINNHYDFYIARTNNIITVSYTHLTLPTNREV